jgi:hypothetical protein
MKCLSVRQPWASLIVLGHKNIENRTWFASLRGRVLIHAGKIIDPVGFKFAYKLGIHLPITLPTGGIIGSCEIVDCVTSHASPWFFGPFGFVLANAQYLAFRPLVGKLSFFEVDLAAPPATAIPAEPLFAF